MKNIADTIDSALPIEELQRRIQFMSQFMMPDRLANMQSVLGQRLGYMRLCTENTFHPQNASALIRTCEAFGIQDIHTVETLCKFNPNVNIVRGTDKWVDLHRHGSPEEMVADLRTAGYRIVATMPHTCDTTPEQFDIEAGPFAVVFGTEHAGVSQTLVEQADHFIRIPMYGFVESLNLSASAAIIMHILSQRLRQSNIDWSLRPQRQVEILYRWVMESVRDSQNILEQHYIDKQNNGTAS